MPSPGLRSHPIHCWTLLLKFSWFSIKYVAKKWISFDIIYNLYFSVDHVFRTNRITCIPTIQGTIPVPSRPSAADCMALIRYGQHLSNTRTVYGCTRIQVWCSALDLTAYKSSITFRVSHSFPPCLTPVVLSSQMALSRMCLQSNFSMTLTTTSRY